MVPSNLNKTSSVSHKDFRLLGFPEVTKFRPLLALPFSFIYTVILSANSVVMLVIALEESLHTPMYTLIFSLLAGNVVYTTAITPKMLLSLFGLNEISLAGCLAQIFTILTSIMAESITLLLMAVDRYLAISRPLHYQEIILKQLLVHSAINGLLRNCLVVLPVVILSSSVRYCRSNIINHFYCENMMLLGLGCQELRGEVIGLLVRTAITVCDIVIIFLSYLKILQTVLRIALGAARYKALHTCSTNLVVVVITYASGILISSFYMPGISTSYTTQNTVSAIHFLFPAIVNPFIYGIRMEEIKDNLQKWWRKKKNISWCTEAYNNGQAHK
ncbi:olfactory receptor 56B34-like [Hyperolius riggenbachi]|uniref:olfactory receptor 56B34-like n=1 Tax=Hyperolius riggenbachi TaxID=752182 RepID=UPI0035A2EDE0